MKNKKWQNEELEKAAALLKGGKTFKDIAIELRRTAKAVKVMLNKNGYSYLIEQKEKRICLNCGKEINVTKKSEKKFCNNSCAAKYNNHKRKKIRLCLNCGKELDCKQKKFCSNTCGSFYKRKLIFKKIENGDCSLPGKNYKNYLIHKYGEKCMKCGWNEVSEYSKKIPIELEHIDGNSENNNLSNLKLLCPNCHSLTSTYRFLNVGNGRYKRKQRYHDGKSF